ncbi:MAG TPA: hypothetical protein VMU89_11210 [Thermomicrobiaceae bacterium]|nr:hypothetical protein [Thermomicrobiaceae bacterium]
MGYCPRCGDNQSFGDSPGAPLTNQPGRLRIPNSTRIVDLGDPPDGSLVSYGGSRFRIRRQDHTIMLELVG